jgi:hypothetical protein
MSFTIRPQEARLDVWTKRTTPEPCADVATLFPEIAKLGRVAYRLHWVAESRVDPALTRFGGPILWPRAELWPVCEEHQQPHTAVLQIRAADVPEIEFFSGTDLLQILWCACDHGVQPIPGKPFEVLTGWTKLAVFWRRSGEIGERMAQVPAPTELIDEYVPQHGRVYPERIVEYPGLQDLPPHLAEALKARDARPFEAVSHPDREYQRYFAEGLYRLYENQLSACPGTKIGGYVSWIQHASVPVCECGRPSEHLLTIASTEWDGGSIPRWRPVEVTDSTADSGPGLMLGDCGSIHVFLCRNCGSWPVRWRVECC